MPGLAVIQCTPCPLVPKIRIAEEIRQDLGRAPGDIVRMPQRVRVLSLIFLGAFVVAGCGSRPVQTRSALPPRKAAPDLIRAIEPPQMRLDRDSRVPRPGFGQGVAGVLVDAQPQADRSHLDLVPGSQRRWRLDA